MLTRLIYYSSALEEPSLQSLQELVEKASHKNEMNGISGLLYYADRYFLQVLEGKRASVSELYSRISQDPRHFKVTLMSFCEASEKIFPKWGMKLSSGSLHNRTVYQTIVQKFGFSDGFEPARLTGEGALGLLTDLSYDLVVATAVGGKS